jgi:glycosyltransferase involved in cell wall biosynthesis
MLSSQTRAKTGHPASRVSENWYISFEAPDDWGNGLATYCRHVIRAADAAGRSIRLFHIAKGSAKRTSYTNNHATCVMVQDTVTKELSPLGYWMNLSWIFADRVCREIEAVGKPLSIEIPDGFALGYYLLQRKLVGDNRLKDVPIILLAHTPVRMIDEWNGREVHTLPNWWTYRAEQWCFKAADAVITLSSMLEEKLRAANYLDDDQTIQRSFNPYITEHKNKEVPRKETSNTLVVGMASRMINWKGLREALAVAREVKKTGQNIRFEFCGSSTSDFDRARTDFSDVFLSGTVEYLGVLSEQDLNARRQYWSCQIHPSKLDNFPYSVVEALSAGTPCLMSEGNGVAEALEPELKKLLVCDFSKPGEVIRAIRSSTDTRKLLALARPPCSDATEYFSSRDDIIVEIGQSNRKKDRFPFIQADQSKSGLKPIAELPRSSTGARITVVVPYYNMGKYISDCVLSILGSTIPTDVVIVNDGSTDRLSIEKLKEYHGHQRIHVFDVPNGGVAQARNFGVAQAKTEFVALLDADDTVKTGYYEKAISILDKYDNVGFVGCWSNDYSDETGETLRYWPTYNAEPLPNIIMNNTNCQALIYRRNLYNMAGQHDPALKMFLDDWDGMLGMLEHGFFGVMLPEPLFNYRQRTGSIFSSNRGAWDVNFAYIVRKRRRLYASNYEEALLFSNANGPNRSFHLLGWHTPVNLPAPATSRFKQSLVRFWDRLPKPVQKAVMPVADFIDRLVR